MPSIYMALSRPELCKKAKAEINQPGTTDTLTDCTPREKKSIKYSANQIKRASDLEKKAEMELSFPGYARTLTGITEKEKSKIETIARQLARQSARRNGRTINSRRGGSSLRVNKRKNKSSKKRMMRKSNKNRNNKRTTKRKYKH